jgi:hypothetical protein
MFEVEILLFSQNEVREAFFTKNPVKFGNFADIGGRGEVDNWSEPSACASATKCPLH